MVVKYDTMKTITIVGAVVTEIQTNTVDDNMGESCRRGMKRAAVTDSHTRAE
jgi:hypothetical protein